MSREQEIECTLAELQMELAETKARLSEKEKEIAQLTAQIAEYYGGTIPFAIIEAVRKFEAGETDTLDLCSIDLPDGSTAK